MVDSSLALHKCNTFNDTKVQVHAKAKDPFNTTITGCIERIQEGFNGEFITELYARNQNIPIFRIDTIRNMAKLSVASFFNCEVKEIVPGAFRNVPRLNHIAIVYGNLSKVHKDVFNDLFFERIRLNNNHISDIANGAFSNLPTLRSLYLANNNIKKIDPGWLVNSTNLQVFDLQFNKISTIQRHCFKSLPRLNELYLDFNEIVRIEEHAFFGITKLQYLGLSYNHIKQLSINPFSKGLKMHSLFIDANRLNYIPNEVLAKIEVQELTISGNPWKCPCLDRINHWMNQRNGTITTSPYCEGNDVPVCIFPERFSTTCIEDVDEEVTSEWFKRVQEIRGKVDQYCIRFD